MPDMGLVRGLVTVLTLGAFLGICWWAYRPSNQFRFDDDAWMPFEDDERKRLTSDSPANEVGDKS